MTKPKIILDCDPGHDDAVAILMAGRLCEVLGITTVGGNVPLELTTRNALLCTQILNLDIPVHEGIAVPLNTPPVHAPDIHGESGLGGPVLPKLERELASTEAVRFIIDSARSHDDLYLIATGPLTNVAVALSQAPDIAKKLKGISIMGGGSFGNRTPAAEFNIFYDPEAADIVFRSGATIIMSGLDLTHQFTIEPENIETMKAMNSAAAKFVSDMLEFFGGHYKERYFNRFFAPLHDPCAVMAITHPEFFEFQDRQVVVELHGSHTRGMTLIDERGIKLIKTTNTRVAKKIDREMALNLLLETMASYA